MQLRSTRPAVTIPALLGIALAAVAASAAAQSDDGELIEARTDSPAVRAAEDAAEAFVRETREASRRQREENAAQQRARASAEGDSASAEGAPDAINEVNTIPELIQLLKKGKRPYGTSTNETPAQAQDSAEARKPQPAAPAAETGEHSARRP